MKIQEMTRFKLAVLVLCTITLIASFCAKKDTYRPVYYPGKNNLTIYTRGPTFDNLAQARQWAEDHHRQRGDLNWTYEIGKNCKPFGKDSDIEICEETFQ